MITKIPCTIPLITLIPPACSLHLHLNPVYIHVHIAFHISAAIQVWNAHIVYGIVFTDRRETE